MSVLRICKFPEQVLRKKSKPVALVTEDEKRLVDDMLETMYLNQGVGLAAPQVGVSKRLIVVDVGEGPVQLINPIITEKSGSEAGQEGCLSLPGVMVEVRRGQIITYKALDREGRAVENRADGLLARAIQHEIDHLDGRIIIDYANPIKRIFLKNRLIKESEPS
jgi:peptide deformylase